MAQAIPLALTVGGSLLSAGGSIIGGKAAKRAANAQADDLMSEASQLRTQAADTRATSQRSAIQERRQARLLQSRGQAVAAASGAGADDASVVDQLAGIEGEGEYRALTALYEGDTAAKSMEDDADARTRAAIATRKAGKANAMASYLSAGGSILSAGSTIYDRFGGKK